MIKYNSNRNLRVFSEEWLTYAFDINVHLHYLHCWSSGSEYTNTI